MWNILFWTFCICFLTLQKKYENIKYFISCWRPSQCGGAEDGWIIYEARALSSVFRDILPFFWDKYTLQFETNMYIFQFDTNTKVFCPPSIHFCKFFVFVQFTDFLRPATMLSMDYCSVVLLLLSRLVKFSRWISW